VVVLIAKNSVGAISLARDDFQKMVGSFLRGKGGTNTPVSSVIVPVSTVKKAPTNHKGSIQSKSKSSNTKTARPVSRSLSTCTKENTAKKQRKSKHTKPTRSPLTPLMTIKTTTHSNKMRTTKKTVPPSSPTTTIASCVTPKKHQSKPVKAAATKAKLPKPVKAVRAKKRRRSSSICLSQLTDDEEFGFLSQQSSF